MKWLINRAAPLNRCRSPTEATVIETRVALPIDAESIRAIRHRSFATLRDTYTPNADTQGLNPLGARHRYEIVAVVAGQIAGVVCVTVEGAVLRLSGLGVLPEFRRRGIARSLIEHAQGVAFGANCESMRLFTIRETGNVAIFLQLGFSTIGESLAEWCFSDRFGVLNETEMERRCGEP